MSIEPGGGREVGGRSFLAILLVLALGGCLRANQNAPVDPEARWTTYQGEGSRSPFEAERVPRTEPTTVWKADPNRGYSASPVVNGGALISVSTNRMVQGLSLETGDILWEHRKNGPLSVPPLIVGERIFIATSDVDGRVYAIRARDGRGRWDEDVPGLTHPMVADGDVVLMANGAGQVLALRQENGDLEWRARVGPPACGPVVVGDRVLVATDRDSLVALDRRSGRRLAALSVGGQVSATPAVRDGVVFLPLHSGDLVAVRASDLSEAWRIRADGPILAAPVATRDGRIWILDRTGSVWVVEPDGATRRVAALEGAARGSLTVTANAVLVGLLDGRFVALDRATGELLWSLRMKDSIYTPAVVHEGFIYVPLRRGEIVKLG